MRSDFISRIVILSISSPTEIGTRMSCAGAFMRLASMRSVALPAAEHAAADDADAEDVEPALAEIEQVRIEQRRHDVLRPRS